MKALFGSLLCLLFSLGQCLAISGGPNYGSSGTNIVGSYAGVLQGLFDPTNPASSNSIGIFTLGVPKTGNATGNFIMFARGRTFRGTIDAAADPNKASLKGIVSASYDYNLQTVANGVVTSVPVTASVNGPINATASAGKVRSTASTAILLKGDATLYISSGKVTSAGDAVIAQILLLNVNGFKQSSSTATGG